MVSTVLFGLPQSEIASLMTERMTQASSISIVTGFATPGGLAAIADPVKAAPQKLHALVIGAATYKGFEALDELLDAGVPSGRLHVHLGHTGKTGGKKHPFARFHPMLHSKVYLMEMPGDQACAFIGSHNVTAFALTGLNGEAAVLLEGSTAAPEFGKVRQHIDAARSQAVVYDPTMKEAYAWWTREFIDGLRSEVGLPQDWSVVRTILLFAKAGPGDRPKVRDQLYFEIPAGIEQIKTLETETHLFLFDDLPASPSEALNRLRSAVAQYTCIIRGVENMQGNRELSAQWRIDGLPRPSLVGVPEGSYRPSPPAGMQQVRAEVKEARVVPFEYLFERENAFWDPEFTGGAVLTPTAGRLALPVEKEAKGGSRVEAWHLVKGLRRTGIAREKDEAALKRAAPESGAFVLVSLRRRQRGDDPV